MEQKQSKIPSPWFKARQMDQVVVRWKRMLVVGGRDWMRQIRTRRAESGLRRQRLHVTCKHEASLVVPPCHSGLEGHKFIIYHEKIPITTIDTLVESRARPNHGLIPSVFIAPHSQNPRFHILKKSIIRTTDRSTSGTSISSIHGLDSCRKYIWIESSILLYFAVGC